MTGHRAPGRASSLRRAVAVLAVVGALALAAAVVGEAADRGRALQVDLPLPALVLGADALVGAIIAAGVLLAAATVWALATAPRRREFEGRPWWHTAVGLVLLAVVAVALSWLIREGLLSGHLDRLAELQQGFRAGASDAPFDPSPSAAREVNEALRQGAVVTGALVILLAAGLFAVRRRQRSDEPAGRAERATASLTEAVEAALADLGTEGDARQAILRCYRHLEAALAAAGCARQAAETPREHRHRAATMLGPAARAAARLIDRFERARYDVTPVGEADRREALAALEEVRAELTASRGGARAVHAPSAASSGGGAPRPAAGGRAAGGRGPVFAPNRRDG